MNTGKNELSLEELGRIDSEKMNPNRHEQKKEE